MMTLIKTLDNERFFTPHRNRHLKLTRKYLRKPLKINIFYHRKLSNFLNVEFLEDNEITITKSPWLETKTNLVLFTPHCKEPFKLLREKLEVSEEIRGTGLDHTSSSLEE